MQESSNQVIEAQLQKIEAYAQKLSARTMLVARACWRLAEKRKEVGLTSEEEQAAADLGHCRTHLEAENTALAFFRGKTPEPQPHGTLAQVLTALGDDQYKGQGTLSERQLVVARLAQYEAARAITTKPEPEPAKQLDLFGKEVAHA